jgi:peptidoglycan hydrolase-like protein with peptidoglycan-binding domain
MSTITKKIASIVISTTTVLALSMPVAFGQTAADIQAQINALLAQIQALQAQLGQVPAPAAVSVPTITRNLTVGSRGAEVKALQDYLKAGGYLVIATTTTYFGPMTKAAVQKWQAASALPSTGFFGPMSRAKLAELAVAVPPVAPVVPVAPVAPVPAVGLAVALATDNPVSATIPKGATSVAFLKFIVSGTDTLSSLTFKRTGIGAVADFTSGGINLWDGSTRLTTGRSISSTTHEVSFVNLNLAISGTKTLTLTGDIAGDAITGNRNAFSLVSSSPSVTGALAGNEMPIAGQTVGSVTINNVATPASPRIGQVGVLISDFRLTASATEDITVNRLIFTQGGSIAKANLSNFVLKQAGNTLATASAIVGRDLVTFDLATPFAIEKGQNRTFEVYADIAGAARANDTINLYIDSAADVYAIGKTYGYGVGVTNAFSSAQSDSLTVQGGQVTITFNGPAAGDLAARGQDLTLFDFTIATQNNIEIRKLRYNIATTNMAGAETLRDIKVWDMTLNSVVTSAINATTTNGFYSDIINISAGTSKRFKVTADMDAAFSGDETVVWRLNAFQAGDIRNLDNNTDIAVADIVPNANVTGNTMSVKVVSLESSLAGAPASRNVVAGASNVDLVGFNFRAVAGNIRINSIKVSATPATGTHAQLQNDVQSVGLYVAGTRISDLKNFTGTVSNIVFSNLNYTISAGETKTIVVRAGALATNATADNVYRAYIDNLDTDVSATDVDGNTVSAGTGTLNTTVQISVKTASIQVAKVTNLDTEAGLVMANGERILSAFDFYAANADVSVKKIKLGVNSSVNSSATTTALIEEVSQLKLYDGATLIATGSLIGSGFDAGRVKFDAGVGTLFTVPANSTKQIVVKGVLANIDATSGAVVSNLASHVLQDDFEAVAGTQTITTLTNSPQYGNLKRMYKTVPTITTSSASRTLVSGQQVTHTFTITAGSNEKIDWKKIEFNVTLSNATLVTNDIVLESAGTIIPLVAASSTIATTGGEGIIVLATSENIDVGRSKTYDIKLKVNITNPANPASVSTQLKRDESDYVTPGNVATVAVDENSFVWSDFSIGGHSETTADWHNSWNVKILPGYSTVLSK